MGFVEFSLAGLQDDAQLRARMAEDWMDGRIAVSFRREPSYFAGCALQGAGAEVIKGVDEATGRIVAMGSRLHAEAYVNGAPARVGYLADLRTAPSHRRGTTLARGYRYLRRLHEADPLPYYYTIIFDGNAAALRALIGGRAGLPAYVPRGRILTPAILLDFPRAPIAVPGITFARGSPAEKADIARFLDARMAARQFAPVLRAADLDAGGRLRSLACEDFYLAKRGGAIVGTLAAWDQAATRQTHIERYPPALALARPLVNAASLLTPLKPLPAPGARIPFLYFAFVAVEGDDLALMRALLRHAYNDRRRGPWHYAIAGLHESDPLAAALDDYRTIGAAGLLFTVHFSPAGDPSPPLDGRVPRVEMALA